MYTWEGREVCVGINETWRSGVSDGEHLAATATDRLEAVRRLDLELLLPRHPLPAHLTETRQRRLHGEGDLQHGGVGH